MKVKEAIEVLKTFPQDAEIQMFCSHEQKFERAFILTDSRDNPAFIPYDEKRQPFVYCSS